MCDTAFAVNESDTYFFECPSKRFYSDHLPADFQDRFDKGDVDHVIFATLGAHQSYVVIYKDPQGRQHLSSHGLPEQLEDWLYELNGDGIPARNFAKLKVSLGPNNDSYLAFDDKSTVSRALPQALVKRLDELAKFVDYDYPRLVSLGANKNFILITEGNGVLFELKNYRSLQKTFFKMSLGAGGYANIANVFLDPYRQDSGIILDSDGNLSYTKPTPNVENALARMVGSIQLDFRHAKMAQAKAKAKSKAKAEFIQPAEPRNSNIEITKVPPPEATNAMASSQQRPPLVQRHTAPPPERPALRRLSSSGGSSQHSQNSQPEFQQYKNRNQVHPSLYVPELEETKATSIRPALKRFTSSGAGSRKSNTEIPRSIPENKYTQTISESETPEDAPATKPSHHLPAWPKPQHQPQSRPQYSRAVTAPSKAPSINIEQTVEPYAPPADAMYEAVLEMNHGAQYTPQDSSHTRVQKTTVFTPRSSSDIADSFGQIKIIDGKTGATAHTTTTSNIGSVLGGETGS